MSDRELTQKQLKRLLMVTSSRDVDLYDSLWFCTYDNNSKLATYVNCNDFFAWGCSDSEPVASEADIDLLQQSIDDCKGDGTGDNDFLNVLDAALLYCARRRQMRPQGAFYKHLQKDNHKLFDACGPEREINFINPKDQDGEYKYVGEKKEEKITRRQFFKNLLPWRKKDAN